MASLIFIPPLTKSLPVILAPNTFPFGQACLTFFAISKGSLILFSKFPP